MAKFTVGTIEFPTKAAAKQRLNSIATSYRSGELVGLTEDIHLLLNVVSIHAWHKKVNLTDIAGFRVVLNEFRSKVINIVFKDGKEVKLAHGRIFEKFNKTKADVFREKCRREIAPQIIAFKQKAFESSYAVECELTGTLVNWKNVHIDHIYPFECLVQDFLKLHKGENGAYLVRMFGLYHAENAKLRCVSKAANMGRTDDNCD